jgi:hypothetical protein
MAATVLQAVARRASPDSPLWTSLTQFRRVGGGEVVPVDTEVAGVERPPMRTIPEYRRQMSARR